MTSLVKPHGGALVERVVYGETARAAAARAHRLPSVQLDARAIASLELLASGGAAPLRGFTTHGEYRSVLDRQRLLRGLLFPLPLVLPVRPGKLGAFPPGSEVALRDESGAVRGMLLVTDTFVRDLREEALLVHGTADPAHPRVAQLLRTPPGALGGDVTLLREPDTSFESTREVRLRLARQGFFRVAGGVWRGATRAPAGRGHGNRCAPRPLADAVALDPRLPVVVARAVPALPARPGGRELLFHALVLKNFGASHLVVAGAPRDLGSADALVRARLELGVTPLRGRGPTGVGAPPARRAAA